MKTPPLLLIIAVLLAPFSAYAAEMTDLLPELLNTDERVQAAEHRRDAAIHRLREAKGKYYPQVDFSAEGGWESIDHPGDRNTDDWKNLETLKATQLITDFGKTAGTIRSAERSLERAKAELTAARQDILLEGIIAYLNVLRGREKLTYARESEQNIREQTGMEETLVKKGAGLSSNVLEAKSQLAGAVALRVSVEGELAIALNRFKRVFNRIPEEDEITGFTFPESPAGRLPETLPAVIERALDNNPQIIIAGHRVEIAEQEITVARSRYFPRLNIFAEGNRKENHLGVSGVRNEGLVGLEFEHNLYRGGSDAAAVRASRSNLAEAENLLADSRKRVEENARNAWQNHLTSKENYKYLRNQSAILREFLELARKERKLGNRSLLDVLAGEVNYINAVSLSVSARIDTLISAYELVHAMGALQI
jgi:TolC family type I secretion outer membrane protein